jgi:DNA gyrase subunit A
MEIGTVRQVDINEEMQGAYLDYAMSVIVARALPDVRDGLKPVHRRILYAMHDMGLRSDRPYKKSARIVGEVLGKYHPHGDAAVYEAMARMAQDFSLRYVVVDGQGNFGSIDGDSPAAMRYTEARMSTIAEEMLADIDKDTVDFSPNFDDTLNEPAVLPAVLPNLLVNGASGIAVGMTTSIPPHNLGEVCDALVYLIDNWAELDEVTIKDLNRFIEGPDFPTGGVVYRYAGDGGDGERTDLIRNAYALGRGRLTVQAHLYIEEMSRNRSRIVVSELPYQVNKTRLIERIADLVRDGRIEGITDLRDESDRQGMRICIELTRTVDPREVLSQLFKLTPMQTTFSVAMLALVDGEPRLLPLKRILIHYLEHRQEIITRRSSYLLERAKERAHILEGLLKALDRIDEVTDTIRRSRTVDMARSRLMTHLSLSETQAQAILDMPLRRLAGLERRKLADEHQEKQEEIKYLQSLLRSPSRIRAVIREDLLALKELYGDARRTRIVDQEKGHHTARDLVEAEEVLLTLWQDGQATRTAKPPPVSAKAVPMAQLWGNTRDDAAFFTASGLAVLVPMHQIPNEQNILVSSVADLDRSETVVGTLLLQHPPEGEEPPGSYLTLVTQGGRIKRVTVKDLVNAGRGPVTVMNVEQDDRLAWVTETGGQDEIVLVTRQGKAIRFSEEEVRAMGLPAAGVLAVKLADDDAVVGMGVARDGSYVLAFSGKGYGKRTEIDQYPTQKRYGGGIQAAKTTDRTGPLAVAALASEHKDLVLATANGLVTSLPVEAIQIQGRATQGGRLRQDNKEPYLDPDKHGPPVLLTVLAGTVTAGRQTRAKGDEPDGPPRKTRTKRSRSKKSSSSRKKSGPIRPARSKGDGTATQIPLPLESAPAKRGRRKPHSSKEGDKSGTRKRGPVRSVPESKKQRSEKRQ